MGTITVNQELQSKNTALAQASHITCHRETIREPLWFSILSSASPARTMRTIACFASRGLKPRASLFTGCRWRWDIPALRDLLITSRQAIALSER
jgi:hypothetical protein